MHMFYSIAAGGNLN